MVGFTVAKGQAGHRLQLPPTPCYHEQVVLMNQVTTKVVAGGEHSRLVPALGDSWAHAATSRVILYWDQQVRKAFIYKSPTQPAAAAEYFVTAEGVRGKRAAKRPRPG